MAAASSDPRLESRPSPHQRILPGYGKEHGKTSDQVRKSVHGRAEAEKVEAVLQAQRNVAVLKPGSSRRSGARRRSGDALPLCASPAPVNSTQVGCSNPASACVHSLASLWPIASSHLAANAVPACAVASRSREWAPARTCAELRSGASTPHLRRWTMAARWGMGALTERCRFEGEA